MAVCHFQPPRLTLVLHSQSGSPSLLSLLEPPLPQTCADCWPEPSSPDSHTAATSSCHTGTRFPVCPPSPSHATMVSG